jgi:superfamily I DNA and/or RNA helicase
VRLVHRFEFAVYEEVAHRSLRWVRNDLDPVQVKHEDILVVASCNQQVRYLRAALPEAVRVGTVDKFQGQEAPVVFYSTTSSRAMRSRAG